MSDDHGERPLAAASSEPGDLVAGAELRLTEQRNPRSRHLDRMSTHTDQYLVDIIEHGGAPVGRPGMPAFGYHLSDDDIQALVAYLRTLPGRRP